MRERKHKFFRNSWEAIRSTVSIWQESKCLKLGAAVAYYTTFSIVPIFLITLAIIGILFEETEARKSLLSQINGLIGPQSAEAIGNLVSASSNDSQTGTWGKILAGITLVFGATGAFVELQDSLNTIWQIERKPGSGWLQFIKTRLLSFAMVIGVGFLLLVSLVVSAALSSFGNLIAANFDGGKFLLNGINFILSFGVITCLFAAILKVLPDAKIAWRDVWIGALLTALLFNVGKFLLGYYLGRSSVTDSYGAGRSIVIILLWVYYSAQIVFIGAAFTRFYANRYDTRLKPGSHAKPGN